jgi:hypothetical protein
MVLKQLFLAILSFLVVVPGFAQATQQAAAPSSQQQAPSTGPSTGKHYTNSSGQRVHTPIQSPSAPAGSTAKCRDGSYSFSRHARGTCSHHGGVSMWLIH